MLIINSLDTGQSFDGVFWHAHADYLWLGREEI